MNRQKKVNIWDSMNFYVLQNYKETLYMAKTTSTKMCIHDTIINGLSFIHGLFYKVEYNPIMRTFIIYNKFGYTDITKQQIEYLFI